MEPKQLDSLLHPQFDADALKKAKEVAKGLAASPGAACGMVYFTAEEATAAAKTGQEGRPGPSGDLSGRHRRHGGMRRAS